MGRKKAVEVEPKNKFDKRAEIRDYIKNERDTILKKWMALEEGIKAEDHRRDEFAEKRVSDLTRKLPENIRKFIGTLKKAVRKTMAKTGGTPYSIIRNMFLYWDADKSGAISAEELKGAVNSLGARMTEEQREEVVKFYSDENKISRAEGGELEMNYYQLLKDIQKGEPTIIDSNPLSKFKKIEECFEEVQVLLPEKTLIVKQFIEATQNFIGRKMRIHGGTPYQHCRDLFTHYDYDFSSGLNAEELRRAGKKGMGLDITTQQAQEIINYYDFKNTGQLTIHMGFIEDVNSGVQHILAYTEVTATARRNEQVSLAANPFMPKPFKAKSNKSIELFKKNVAEALIRKIKELGGTSSSWVKEAFLTWDPRNTGKLSDPEAIIGVAKRIGFDLSKDEALILIKSYDKYGTNELIYAELIKDLKIEDVHFLSDPSVLKKTVGSPTARMPQSVNDSIKKFKNACEIFSKKSHGALKPRDIFHGTFVRFDKYSNGRVNTEGLFHVLKSLNIKIDEKSLADLVTWFDTNASRQLDYNQFTIQLFGNDISTSVLRLPKAELVYEPKSKSSSLPPIGANFGASSWSTTSETTALAGLQLAASNIPVESNIVKQARKAARKQLIMEDRIKVQEKLEEIERARENLVQMYKNRQAKR